MKTSKIRIKIVVDDTEFLDHTFENAEIETSFQRSLIEGNPIDGWRNYIGVSEATLHVLIKDKERRLFEEGEPL